MKSNQVPGMQIAVSYKGELVLSQGFGFSNIEYSIPVSSKSKFRIASVSKPLSAVLTAYLYQNRIIDIDKSVNPHLDGFENTKWDFTIRQLISHAAGIRHYLPRDTNSIEYRNDIQAGLNIIKSDSLLYKPNSKFSYSSYGYNIAGAYLEKITAKSFENLLVDSLFNQIGMVNSTIDHPYRIIPNRTSAYQLNENDEVINANFFDNRYKIPSGGILSTSEDLVKFGNELLYGDYLNKKSIKLLFTPFEYMDEKESDTGFGWITTKDEKGNILYGHLGGITGGCAAIMIYPEKELVVVWLGNLNADWSHVPTITIADYFIEVIEN
ncbi:MAG: beta-lactamase family protein [bacterium]|nr:beta-lactamase family protein [bacterium]